MVLFQRICKRTEFPDTLFHAFSCAETLGDPAHTAPFPAGERIQANIVVRMGTNRLIEILD